jgi:glucose/arabinose dehydrogenase
VREPTAEAPAAEAALAAGQVDLRLIISGLSSPVGVVNAGDGTNRLFVVQQGGSVRVVSAGGALQSGNFLSMAGVAGGFSNGGERGLLGLAFHPSFETNRKLFVYYTNGGGDLVISELTANAAGTSVSIATADPLLTIEHSSQSNHNGGQLAFGPDGYLYIFTGDGGGGGDPGENAQDLNELLGKVLRIAPNLSGGYTSPSQGPPTGRAEIWDSGMRNPWRASFDRANGTLWIADVGQGSYEEINREPAGTGNVNYGWDCREGKHWFETAGCDTSAPWPYTDPVAEYTHAGGNCSVTGGFVYRGTAFPDFVGQYVLGDYCSGRIWTLNAAAGSPTLLLHRDTSVLVSSFGEAENGEVYVTDHAGRLYRVVAPVFRDITNSGFFEDILWAYNTGITSGCSATRFCPDSPVTREQMASFLARALHLPATSTDFFTDDETSQHEANINRVAAAGITLGCAPSRYCPAAFVTRAQMASFLARAFSLASTANDYFDDDDGNQHEANINKVARAGITTGCGTRRYCPDSSVTRGQMVAFLHRALSQ